MAVEHAMFKFEGLKVNSRDDRQTDRMTTKVLSSHPRITCGETNNCYSISAISLYYSLFCIISFNMTNK